MEVKELLKEGNNINSLKLKVTFYARVSTEHELQKTSIKNQIKFFYNYIKSNPNWTYIPGYIDEGISGKNTKKREEFLKMIKDAKNKKFNLILTKSVSRFARNTIDSLHYTDILSQYGIGVIFINDNINTLYSDSEFRLTLMASIAQDELRKLSENIQFGLNQSIERGIVLGNNNLLGYSKTKGKLTIIEKEAKIIREIFKKYSQNKYNYASLSRLINQKYNLKYDSTRIKRILTNPKYKGYYCGRKSKIIDYKHNIRKNIEKEKWLIYKDEKRIPPIVSEKLWNKVNNLIKSKSKTINIFCIEHQKKLKLETKKYKEKKYYYYICPKCLSLSINIVSKIPILEKAYISKINNNTIKIICKASKK